VLCPGQSNLDDAQRDLVNYWTWAARTRNSKVKQLEREIVDLQRLGTAPSAGGAVLPIHRERIAAIDEKKEQLKLLPPIHITTVKTKEDVKRALESMQDVDALVLVGHGGRPGVQEVGAQSYGLGELEELLKTLKGKTKGPHATLVFMGCKAAKDAQGGISGLDFLSRARDAGGFNHAFGTGLRPESSVADTDAEWYRDYAERFGGETRIGTGGDSLPLWYYDDVITMPVWSLGYPDPYDRPEFLEWLLPQPRSPRKARAWHVWYGAARSQSSQ
jgi:hypothetical protein